MVTGIDSFKEWFKGSEEQYAIGRDSNGHQERWITVYRKQNRIVFDASLGNQRGIFLP